MATPAQLGKAQDLKDFAPPPQMRILSCRYDGKVRPKGWHAAPGDHSLLREDFSMISGLPLTGKLGKEAVTMETYHSELLRLIAFVRSALEHANITWSLNSGALIGAIRSRSLVPWDDDIDVMSVATDEEIRKALIAVAQRPVRLVHGLRKDLYTLLDNATVIVQSFSESRPLRLVSLISGSIIEIEPEQSLFHEMMTRHADLVFPLRSTTLQGLTGSVFIPQAPLAFLKATQREYELSGYRPEAESLSLRLGSESRSWSCKFYNCPETAGPQTWLVPNASIAPGAWSHQQSFIVGVDGVAEYNSWALPPTDVCTAETQEKRLEASDTIQVRILPHLRALKS